MPTFIRLCDDSSSLVLTRLVLAANSSIFRQGLTLMYAFLKRAFVGVMLNDVTLQHVCALAPDGLGETNSVGLA